MDVMWNQALALQRIRVLFVDHDDTHDTFIKEMFTHFSCEVTMVRLASTALTMLSTENCQFDLLMEHVESPDSCGIQLLRYATSIGLPAMLMDSIDPLTVVRGMEEGAIFCVERPVSLECIKYAWQHVVREKVRRIRENGRVQEVKTFYESLYMGTIQEEHENNVQHVNIEQSSKYVRSVRTRRNSNSDEESSVQTFRRGVKDRWVEWTPELHAKFVNAVNTLGEGRCYPNDICQIMNVPGLTRMQVASHLQKCRMGMCHYSAGENHDTYYNVDLQHGMHSERPRRFGRMPRVAKNLEHNPNVQDSIANNLSENLNTHFVIQNVNHVHNSKVHTNQQESINHIPFDNMELRGMENGDLSIPGMIMSDDLLILDDQFGTDENIDIRELLKECGLDGALFPNEVSIMQE